MHACLRAGCKINLDLYITGIRKNGWHELDSMFVPLPEPHDTLCVSEGLAPGLRVICETSGIDPSDNTLTRAYDLFTAATGFAPSLALRLVKGIPHGAGLGGGSADAAALLRWLNDVAPAPLHEDALRALAARVGADVPFFLLNVPCRATGIGDCLEPWPFQWGGWHLVLVCPPEQVPTPWAYKAFDAALPEDPNTFLTASQAQAIRRASLEAGSCVSLVNDFEPVVFAAYPKVRMCKEQLLRYGADGAVMSGSGASVCGLFREERSAQAAAHMLQSGDDGYSVYCHVLR